MRIALVLCALSAVLAGVAGAQRFSTTTVQGTVYQANGKPGSGTLQLSWPAFTTAANQAVAAGRTNINIGNDGFVSVSVAPNVGSTPAGLFYTAVYHLSDGTTSTEYWVVPAAAQANLAQVRAQVMPAAQAVQAVSKTYVDQSIQQLTQSLLTSSGGNLTGPLYLNGDPTTPNQAATKHYVDNEFSQTLSSNGGIVTGPLTATRIGAAYQADQFSGSDFGAQLQACLNALDSTYGGTCDARNFSGNLGMASNLVIATANVTVELPCATISTAAQILVAAGTRNVTLHGCASRGTSASSGSQGGTVFLSSGEGALIEVGDPTYAVDTLGFHLDNVAINTTSATAATALAVAIYRTQELNLSSLYLLGNANQTGITLDGTGNYTGGTVQDAELVGFGTGINAVGHQKSNAATTDWLNASTFVRLHIVCATQNGSAIAGSIGINLQQGDGNTFTGGDVESCATALHLGPNAQNNTIVGLRNENSTYQVVAEAGSAYNNWMTGGTMFTGKLSDSGTRNSFLDTFHRSFNALNGDWFGTQQDATLTNHYRLGIGTGNERGLLHRYQTDAGYRWTMGLSDATSGAQFYQVLDELNNVYRLSIGQYNNGQASTNNQTVINAAGTGAVVINGSNNAGTGGVVIGSGGASSATVATINNAGNAQFNGGLQVGGASTFLNSTTVKNGADAEVDTFLWAGATTPQKESFIYKDWNGASQWYMVKDANNNWALNSALGGLDSFKAYQSTNSGDTYINAAKGTGAVRVNYESGSGTAFNIYGGNSSNLYASFSGTNAIKLPGLAATTDKYCLQIDSSGYLSNSGAPCGAAGGSSISAGHAGQIAAYSVDGSLLSGVNTVPVAAGGTGASTATDALTELGALPTAGGTLTGSIAGTGAAFTGSVAAAAMSQTGGSPGPGAAATAVPTMYNLQGMYKGNWWQNVTYGYGDIVTTACGAYISTAYPNLNAQPNAYPNSWVPLGSGCSGSISGTLNLNATLLSNGFYIYDSRNNGSLGRQTFLSGEYSGTQGNTLLRTSAQLFLDGWGSADVGHSAVSSSNIWSPPGGGTNMIWAVRTGYWDTASASAKNQRWFETDVNIGTAPITGIARTWGYDSSSLPYSDLYNYPPGSTLKYQNLSSVAVSTACPSGTPVGSVCMNGQAYTPVTAATLPAASAANKNVMMMVSDAVDSGDCTTGGGTAQALCTSNSSVWKALGGAVFPTTAGPVCNLTSGSSTTCSSATLQAAIGGGVYDGAGAAAAAQSAATAASDPAGAAAAVQATSLQKSANLADMSSASAARTNLGMAITGMMKGNGAAAPSTAIAGTDYQLPLTGSFAYGWALGDSNTAGQFVTANNSYPGQLFGTMLRVPYLNLGVGGSLSYHADSLILNTAIPASSSSLVLYMMGTNNVTAGTNDANYITTFGWNKLAQFAFLALPATKKTLGTAATLSGTWVAGNYLVSKKTSTVGSSATFTANGSTIVVATTMTPANAATASITCDGAATGVTPVLTGSGGSTFGGVSAVGAVAITGLANTAHTCVVQLTGAGTLDFVWGGGIGGSVDGTYPTVMIPGILDRTGADTNTPLYRTQDSNDVATLRGYGLTNLNYVSTTGVISSSYYNDTLHVDEYGYYLLAQTVAAGINTALGVSIPVPPYRGSMMANTSLLPYSTAMGHGAMAAYSGTSSTAYNTAYGGNALAGLTTGIRDSAVGTTACRNLSTGSDNTCVGYNSGPSANNLTFTLNLGSGATTSANGAVQLGSGTNATGNSMQFQGWNLLDASGNVHENFAVATAGTALASAATITPVAQITHVTGTAAIATITTPSVATNGGVFTGCVKLIPDGVFSTTTTGNIGLASTAVVGRVLEECYDGTKWYPSY